ncbi:MAG: YHS domain-containing protein [Desulfobacteraceae bacterium]|jgi:YHS domain-containing protein
MTRLETRTKAIAIPIVDPVCGMNVPPGRVHLITSYRGRSFFFCAEDCRKAFELNPDAYLEPQSLKPKCNWDRYLGTLV